ncbi:MAG TPA: hypothetical protein VGJ21_02450 [Terracidiphilus sp.]
MTVNSDVSERDSGVKVVDFHIRTDQPEKLTDLVSKLEVLVAELKAVSSEKAQPSAPADGDGRG